jgi:hypothetical protein
MVLDATSKIRSGSHIAVDATFVPIDLLSRMCRRSKLLPIAPGDSSDTDSPHTILRPFQRKIGPFPRLLNTGIIVAGGLSQLSFWQVLNRRKPPYVIFLKLSPLRTQKKPRFPGAMVRKRRVLARNAVEDRIVTQNNGERATNQEQTIGATINPGGCYRPRAPRAQPKRERCSVRLRD